MKWRHYNVIVSAWTLLEMHGETKISYSFTDTLNLRCLLNMWIKYSFQQPCSCLFYTLYRWSDERIFYYGCISAPLNSSVIRPHSLESGDARSLSPEPTMAPLHKICVWTLVRKIKRSLSFNQSESRIKDLCSPNFFLTCVQIQLLCNCRAYKLGNC